MTTMDLDFTVTVNGVKYSAVTAATRINIDDIVLIEQYQQAKIFYDYLKEVGLNVTGFTYFGHPSRFVLYRGPTA